MPELPGWATWSLPADQVSDTAIDLSHGLVAMALAGTIDADSLVTVTSNPAAAYQTLCALARTVGVVLRPSGHDAGPIGAQGLMLRRTRLDPRAIAAAARLIGAGARGDAPMVRALALAVVGARTPTPALDTLRAMLDICAAEPRDPQPEGTQP